MDTSCWRRAWAGPRDRPSCPTGGSASWRATAARSRVWERGRGVSRYAYTAGGPNSCVLGRWRARCTCARTAARSGPWRAEEMSVPSIQRIEREGGPAEIIATELDGKRFNGPNDLVFGPDGRLYFTDPGHLPTRRPGAVVPVRARGDGSGRLLAELTPPTFPNGIAIEADGSVVWAESYTGMVRRLRLDTGVDRGHRAPARRQAGRGRDGGGRGRAAVRHDRQRRRHRRASRPTGRYDRFIKAGVDPDQLRVRRARDLIMTDAGVLADTADASLRRPALAASRRAPRDCRPGMAAIG